MKLSAILDKIIRIYSKTYCILTNRLPKVENTGARYNVYDTSPENIHKDAEYTLSIARNYKKCLEKAGLDSFCEKNILEVGPGTNFGTVFFFKALGSKNVHVSDRFLTEYDKKYHTQIYTHIKDVLTKEHHNAKTTIFEQCISSGKHCASDFFVHPLGLENLHSIATKSIDVVLSNAVLEHLAEPSKAFAELARITKEGGIGIHQVDFRDHTDFTKPLNFLLLDNDERRAFTTSRNFTCGNSWRPKEYHDLFTQNGFEIVCEEPNILAEDVYFDDFIQKLQDSQSPYKAYPSEELRAVSVLFIVKKVSTTF